jgi:hypothetical protein
MSNDDDTDFETDRITTRRVGGTVLISQRVPLDGGELVNVTLSIDLETSRAMGERLIEYADDPTTDSLDLETDRLLDP